VQRTSEQAPRLLVRVRIRDGVLVFVEGREDALHAAVLLDELVRLPTGVPPWTHTAVWVEAANDKAWQACTWQMLPNMDR